MASVDVHEEIAAGECLGEIVEKPARYARCIIATVVNEDAGHAYTWREDKRRVIGILQRTPMLREWGRVLKLGRDGLCARAVPRRLV